MLITTKVVVFQVGSEEYGIPIEHVISIEKVEGITPIPHLPVYVKGIVKVRGELLPVIDFEEILYHRNIQYNDQTRMIVVKTDELTIGVFVNDAKEIIDIEKENLKQLGLVAFNKTSYFSSIANLDSRLITLIDPLKLVQSLEGINEIQQYMKSHQEE
ncbi:chemotaxis protein CheW [Robertmurraya korlensis]|uniref:chemotaxis protein CheW n=1 Tax=Robertmurraya korlensis TaxID=519977 RepID=UPI00203CE717|nr:chemotaxis protein CheW [Robertmurraya korlensis]MCM3599673.1 chemotaxis protein CheW [Robertmurraya korlensis]